MTVGSLTAGLSLADTDAAIDQLETDVTALQALTAILELNTQGVATVDMGAADYTLTDAEANCALIVLANVGDGTKTALLPTTSDTTRPVTQIIATLLNSTFVTLGQETGGATASLSPGTVHIVSTPVSTGSIDIDMYIQTATRGASNGIQVLDVGDTTFNDGSAGKLQHAADGAAQTLTIAAGNITPKLSAPVYCSGAGGLTIQGDVGVTVTGNAVLAAGGKCTIYRDASTETYLCV